MKRSSRSTTALVMTAIYLLLILAPLAAAVLNSGMVTPAVAGECTGDCRSCGCSQEWSATRACCCWQKKQAAAKSLRQSAAQKSFPTKTAKANPKSAGNCCNKSAQHADHEDEAASATQADSTTDKETATVSISTCPCGSGKDLLFAAGEEIQHLPCRYAARAPIQSLTQFNFLQPELFATRSGQPPDPPPKIYTLS